MRSVAFKKKTTESLVFCKYVFKYTKRAWFLLVKTVCEILVVSGCTMIVGNAIIILIVAGVCFGDANPESCLRFGGGSCCPVLHALDRPIQEVGPS